MSRGYFSKSTVLQAFAVLLSFSASRSDGHEPPAPPDSAQQANAAQFERRAAYDRLAASLRDRGRFDYFGKSQPVLLRLTLHREIEKDALTLRGLTWGTCISTGYDLRNFYHGPFGSKGGGGSRLPEHKIARLHEILADLPGDAGELPPENHRLVVQADEGESFAVRVYDRRVLPDVVLELVRIFGGRGMGSPTPSLLPDSAFPAVRLLDDFGKYESLALTADGRTVALSRQSGGLELWDLPERRKLREIEAWPSGSGELTFSPDGRFVAAMDGEAHVFDAKTWERIARLRPAPTGRRGARFVQIRFSSDSKQLLAYPDRTQMHVYRTDDWKSTTYPAGLPNTTTSFYPAPVGDMAVVVTDGLNIDLWNTKERKAVARLESDAMLGVVAFSPEGKHVAIETIHRGPIPDRWQERRIRIADVDTGKWRTEVWPHDVLTPDEVSALHWTRDGLHLIGAVKPDHYQSGQRLCVWDTATGRELASLHAGDGNLCGVAFSRDGQHLMAAPADGRLRFWSYAVVLQKIAEYEGQKPAFSKLSEE